MQKLNIRNPKKIKITNQQFDLELIRSKLSELITYKSDPLHWNLDQLSDVGKLGERALAAYEAMSNRLNVPMHSYSGAIKKVAILNSNSEIFKKNSRKLAIRAASREVQTTQPKESVTGEKGMLTITNYLGGEYHLTADEVVIDNQVVQLVEAKHTGNPL